MLNNQETNLVLACLGPAYSKNADGVPWLIQNSRRNTMQTFKGPSQKNMPNFAPN